MQFTWLLPPVWTASLGLLGLLVVAASYWQRPQEVPRFTRSMWVALRAVAVAGVLVLIASPRMVFQTQMPLRNEVWLVLDESRSMTLDDEAPSRFQVARDTLEEAGAALKKRFTVRRGVIGAGEQPVRQWPQQAEKDQSSLGEDLTALSQQMDERLTRAVVVLSDGRVTHGPPLASSAAALGRLGATVIAVPLGKEHQETDLAVTTLDAPQVAAQGTPFEVTLTVQRNPRGPQEATVHLLLDKKNVHTHAFTFEPREEARHLTFKVTADGGGFRKLTARVLPHPEEKNQANNAMERLVKVTLTQARSLVLWGRPDPAMGVFVRLLTDERGEPARGLLAPPEGQTGYGGAVLSGKALDMLLTGPGGLGQFDLLVVGNVDRKALGSAAAAAIERAGRFQGLGVLWVYGEGDPFSTTTLPAPTTWQRSNYLYAPGQRQHPFLPQDAQALLANWPPLTTLAAAGGADPANVVLWATGSYQGASRYPLVACQTRQGRQCAVYSTGVWQWLLAPPPRKESREQAQAFFREVFAFLTDRQAPRRLWLRPVKTRVPAGQPLVAEVEAYDASFEPLAQGSLAITTTCNGEEVDRQTYRDRGRVRYESPPLPAGPCQVQAALKAQDGTFVEQKDVLAEEEDLEMAGKNPDPAALRTLVQALEGQVVHPDDLAERLSKLAPKPVFDTHVREVDLGRSPWLLALVLGVLALEWAWRRRRGVA